MEQPKAVITRRVAAEILDDKGKTCGRLVAEHGNLKIDLEYLPSMVDESATEEQLCLSVLAAMRAAFRADPNSFDPNA